MSFFNGVNAAAIEGAESMFGRFAVGDNEARIEYAEEKVAKSTGRPMVEITFRRDDRAEIKHYIADNEWKLANLKALYEAFGIPMSNRDISDWIDRRGIVVCKEEEYNGKMYPKVSYFKALGNGGNRSGASRTANRDRPTQGSGNNPPTTRGGEKFDDDIPF